MPQHPRLEELISTLERLRAPGGCAWDRDQSHESLVRYLIEETYELVDAIEAGNDADLIEELGDVLYQVVFHSDIAAEQGRFTLDDVAAHMNAKMIGRHPHVFGDRVADTPDAVMEFWEDLKREEKPGRTSVLDGIPQAMPSLLLAEKLVGKAADLEGAVPAGEGEWATEAELGEHLLRQVVAAKDQGFDPERALRSALRGMQDRVRGAESAARASETEV
jgi:XTP/dITP diphosphohydrolase